MDINTTKEIVKKVSRNMVTDLRTKLRNLANKEGMTVESFARKYNISQDDVEYILEGHNAVSLRTFIKILILSNHTIKIQSLEEQVKEQSGTIDIDIKSRPVRPKKFSPRFPDGDYRHAPEGSRPMGCSPRPSVPKTSKVEEDGWNCFDDDPYDEEPYDDEQYGGHYGDHPGNIVFDDAPEPPTPPAPPFRAMSRQQLVDIIEDKLWSSEIDVDDVTKEQLVEFLEEKDRLHRRNAERKAKRDVSEEAMDALKKNLEEAVRRNPHLKDDVERIINRQ